MSRHQHFGKLDQVILDALAKYPEWMATITAKLDGYPDRDSCWIWTGKPDKDGYGKIAIPKCQGSARLHRVVWLALVGPFPEDRPILDHDGPNGCHVRLCANPAHLLPASNRENVVVTGTGWAAVNANRTHCHAGHPLVGDNVLHVRLGRNCRKCQNERQHSMFALTQRAAATLGISGTEYRKRYGRSLRVAREILGEAA